MAGKPCLNIVFLGHVDCGKSLTCGQLMYLCGGFDRREIERYERDRVMRGRGERFIWSLIMDHMHLPHERERGTTIEPKFKKIETPRFFCTLIDASGHRDFVKGTIAAISQADVAILVVAAAEGEFEAGISCDAQTREHALLAFTLGIKQLIVAVNKMDDATVAFNQPRFDKIVAETTRYLLRIGFKADSISFVPISSFTRDNLIERSPNMPWFRGRTLLESIDNLTPPTRPVDLPLRIPIYDVFKIGGIGTVPMGRIVTGTLKVGMEIVISPPGITSNVKSIERHHETLAEAHAGDNVGFNVFGVSCKEICRGMVVGSLADQPPCQVGSFIAQIIVIDHPNQIKRGYTPIVHCHTTWFPCKIERIISKLDRRTGALIEEHPQSIRSKECATVEMIPLRPVCLEPFHEFPLLGRFVIRDMRKTVAVGIIKSVEGASSGPRITKAAIKRPSTD